MIVPVYKVEQYLERCVDSILKQTYQNLEIILVDDGSPDNCPAMCDAVAHRDNRVKVIHQKNGGLSAARNAALDICTGDCIAFVDSDDWLEPTAYEDMMRVMRECDLDIVFCSASIVESGSVKNVLRPSLPAGKAVSPKDVEKKLLTDEVGSQVWRVLFNRHCWNVLRFPVGRLYEDIPVTFRAVGQARKPVGFIDKPLYNYRQNNGGISKTGNPLKPYHIFLGFREHYEYAKVHFPEVEEQCLMKASSFAISVVFNYYSHRPEALAPFVAETEAFLLEHEQEIKHCKGYMRSRKFALDAFYFSRPVFKTLARLADGWIKQK